MNDNKAGKARDEYEAMRVARKLTTDGSEWLDRVLADIEVPEQKQPETQQRGPDV